MSPAKVLIIDDEIDYTQLAAKRIQSAGYDVDCYFHGEGAIAAIRETKPDVILLDIRLPDVSGFEIFEELQADATLKTIPVIFFSALSKKRAYCLDDLKAAGFLTKPYESHELLDLIAAALKHANCQ